MNATDLGDEPAKPGMMENLRVKLARYVFFLDDDDDVAKILKFIFS